MCEVYADRVICFSFISITAFKRGHSCEAKWYIILIETVIQSSLCICLMSTKNWEKCVSLNKQTNLIYMFLLAMGFLCVTGSPFCNFSSQLQKVLLNFPQRHVSLFNRRWWLVLMEINFMLKNKQGKLIRECLVRSIEGKEGDGNWIRMLEGKYNFPCSADRFRGKKCPPSSALRMMYYFV